MGDMKVFSKTVLVFTAIMAMEVLTAKAATTIADVTASGIDPSNGAALSAEAVFVVNGTQLEITLSNTSAADVAEQRDLLCALFFTLSGNPTLVPVSATLLGGSAVFNGPDGGGNVGGEWSYDNGISGPHGASQEISSTGLGFINDPNFGGSDLNSNASGHLDGSDYGITSAGDNTSTAITGGNPYIKNSVKFVLNLNGYSLTDASQISTVNFQYGTGLDEPNIIPEPTSFVLAALGIASAGMLLRRRS
jgi:hypothetical protein